MQEQSFSLLKLVPILNKWRKQISIIGLVSAVGTLIIALFLPNYYESSIKFIATNTGASSPAAVFGGGVNYPYGSQEDNERLITVAESRELIDFLIDSLRLGQHYDIIGSDNLARFKIIKQFKKQYKVIRNIHGGIEIRYEDKNPVFAANLLTLAIQRIANLDHAAANANLYQTALTLEKSLVEKKALVESLTDSINQINRQFKYASLELRRQALSQASPSMTSDMQWALIAKAANISADSLASIQEALTTAGFLDARRADIHSNYISQSEMLRRVKATLETNTQTLQVIEKANIPLKKSRPQRALLVIGVSILSVFFAILGILVYEKR